MEIMGCTCLRNMGQVQTIIKCRVNIWLLDRTMVVQPSYGRRFKKVLLLNARNLVEANAYSRPSIQYDALVRLAVVSDQFPVICTPTHIAFAPGSGPVSSPERVQRGITCGLPLRSLATLPRVGHMASIHNWTNSMTLFGRWSKKIPKSSHSIFSSSYYVLNTWICSSFTS
jgi:hypothetical protein